MCILAITHDIKISDACEARIVTLDNYDITERLECFLIAAIILLNYIQL